MSSVETLRGSLEHLDEGSVRDALAMVLSGVEPVGGATGVPIHHTAPNSLGDELEKAKTLADALRLLKQRLSIPELGKFAIEGDVVWVTINNRRFQITETPDPTTETPRTRPAEGAGSAAPTPSASGPDGGVSPAKSSAPVPPPGGAERFKNLEL